MDTDVETFVKSCRSCVLVSAPDPPIPMIRKELPCRPWQDIAIDFLGPLPNGENLLVVVDYYSRYVEVSEMKNTTVSETIIVLTKIFSTFGLPSTIRADNGPQFNAGCEEFKLFCQENGIQLINTIPYWPQQNGEVERQNRSILKRLRIANDLVQKWRRVLHQYLLSYHSTTHPTTGKTPAELMFRRCIRNKLPQVPRFSHQDEEMRDQDRIQKEKGRIYADKKRRACSNDIQENDRVLVKRFRKDNKLSTEYDPEEYIVEHRSEADVRVKSTASGKVYRRHISHIKRLPSPERALDVTNSQIMSKLNSQTPKTSVSNPQPNSGVDS
ncbi:uncharacterized protein K02A2.6-like [Uranotaenia lowii]|uniref:uncharacterized protein K02A2.6-like n=1 Tax=Uranotaenia lowii TaxID=190385 RepID=UPI0024784D27|nr:uncharacterized protein K02A2.6-like [Uranotaenia lowii]